MYISLAMVNRAFRRSCRPQCWVTFPSPIGAWPTTWFCSPAMAGMSSPNGATVHGLKNLAQIVVWCGMIPFHATHTHARTHDILYVLGSPPMCRPSSCALVKIWVCKNHQPGDKTTFTCWKAKCFVCFQQQFLLNRNDCPALDSSFAAVPIHRTQRRSHNQKQNKGLCSFLSAHVIRHFKKNGNTAKTT
jgi:hypothetical protein